MREPSYLLSILFLMQIFVEVRYLQTQFVEELRIRKNSLRIGKNSLRISKNSLRIGKNSLRIGKNSLRLKNNSLKIKKNSSRCNYLRIHNVAIL